MYVRTYVRTAGGLPGSDGTEKVPDLDENEASRRHGLAENRQGDARPQESSVHTPGSLAFSRRGRGRGAVASINGAIYQNGSGFVLDIVLNISTIPIYLVSKFR